MSDRPVHPGAFCSPIGATGSTAAGTPMVCAVGPNGGRPRQRRAGPTPKKPSTPRRGRTASAASSTPMPAVNTGITPHTAPPPADLDKRIRDAYAKLSKHPGAYIDLTDLRKELADVPRDQLDKALVALGGAHDARLEPEVLRHRIGDPQRDAAVRFGGDNAHKLAIGAHNNTGPSPADTPTPTPAPAPVDKPTTTTQPAPPTVDGHYTDRRRRPNSWGDLHDPNTQVHYHGDGPIGYTIASLGADRQIDMGDGEPLADTLGLIATRVVKGYAHPRELPDQLRQVRDRLPAGSSAHRLVDNLIGKVDHPMTPKPDLPASTPPAVRDLVDQLHDIPVCRKDTKELDRIVTAARDYDAGRISGLGFRDALNNEVYNQRHESTSDCGKIVIDKAVNEAKTRLEAWVREDPRARNRRRPAE